MKTLGRIIAVFFVTISCNKNEVQPTAENEFMTAIWLNCDNPLNCTKSTTTKFEALSVTAIKFTDGNGADFLQINGNKGASLNAESISISIPYVGVGNYSSTDTGLSVHYSIGGIQWTSANNAGGAYVEVLMDENEIVEGNFRYIGLSTYNNASPPVIGHDNGLFRVKVD